MKKVIVILLCVVGFYACVAECRPPKKPANLKPLDCENYNDVRTVYYNFVQFCKDYPPYNPACDTIKIEGWGWGGYNDYIVLYPDSNFTIGTRVFDKDEIYIYVEFPVGIPYVDYNFGYYYITGIYGYRSNYWHYTDLIIKPIHIDYIEKRHIDYE